MPQSSERAYTIVPMEGMEVVQKYFVKYRQKADEIAEQIATGRPQIPLHHRFQLLERGFVLTPKEGYTHRTMFDDLSVTIDYNLPKPKK
ncbi:hypothetical protein AAVH_09374 [Aphelenchoides avenae]|nr:hypothetical protein AAVH_09374 [Aphelenchus avenae]